MTAAEPTSFRRRCGYALAAVGAVGLGLLWRSSHIPLTPFLRKYGGDALWSAMVYLLIRFCAPRMSVGRSATLALGFAVVIEFSQLHHAPWIDSIRRLRLSALILGSTFNWPDIPAYALGILLAAFLDHQMVKSTPQGS